MTTCRCGHGRLEHRWATGRCWECGCLIFEPRRHRSVWASVRKHAAIIFATSFIIFATSLALILFWSLVYLGIDLTGVLP